MRDEVLLNGLPCERPAEILAGCAAHGFPTDWYDRYHPNIWIERRGPEMSEGFFIVSKDTLSSLSKTSTSLTATFRLRDDGGAIIQQAVVAGLMLVPPAVGLTTQHSYSGATPSAKGDTAYLVHVADIRARKWRKSDRKFNVRCPPTVTSGTVQTYYADSRNAGSDWTWETAFDVLVTDCTDLTATNLPWTPGHKPENRLYVGIRSIDALNQYLESIGCRLARNWSTGAFTVVRLGATDAAYTTLRDANWTGTNFVIFDEDPQTWDHGRVPSQVTVYFSKVREYYGTELVTRADAGNNDAMLTPISRSVTAASLGFSDVSGATGDEPIWSSIPAVVDFDGTETATSVTDTTAAADVEADRFYRKLMPRTRMHRIHTGIVAFHTGSMVREVAFIAPKEGGIITEVADYADDDIGPAIGGGAGWNGTAEPLAADSMPPDINRKSWPQSYHERVQVLRLSSVNVSTSPASGVTAYVQRINPATQAFSDGEEVRAFYFPGLITEAAGVLPWINHHAGERVLGIKCGSDTVGGTIYDTYYIMPTASNFFPAIITATGAADSSDRYTYTISEIEYTANTAGYGQMATKSGGRSGSAYNFLEDSNVNNGKHMNGVTESNLPAGFSIQAIPVNAKVIAWEMKRHSAGTVTADYWFFTPQGIDGACVSSNDPETNLAQVSHHLKATTPGGALESLSSGGSWGAAWP